MEFITISELRSPGQRPRNNIYNFKEETYVLSPNDSFSMSCIKFNFEGKL